MKPNRKVKGKEIEIEKVIKFGTRYEAHEDGEKFKDEVEKKEEEEEEEKGKEKTEEKETNKMKKENNTIGTNGLTDKNGNGGEIKFVCDACKFCDDVCQYLQCKNCETKKKYLYRKYKSTRNSYNHVIMEEYVNNKITSNRRSFDPLFQGTKKEMEKRKTQSDLFQNIEKDNDETKTLKRKNVCLNFVTRSNSSKEKKNLQNKKSDSSFVNNTNMKNIKTTDYFNIINNDDNNNNNNNYNANIYHTNSSIESKENEIENKSGVSTFPKYNFYKYKSSFTICEIKRHNKMNDCWVIANGNVYDATSILKTHPGGAACIFKKAGTDVSLDYSFHSKVAQKYYWEPLKIGNVVKCPRYIARKEEKRSFCGIM